MEEQIIVNHFMFCEPHGEEFCPRCCVDHRFGNNVQVEDALSEILEECILFSLEDRTSINAYEYHAMDVPGVGKDGEYSCSEHGTVDCRDCFNWAKLIAREAYEAERRKREEVHWLEKRKRLAERLNF
ncbi:hypothetical protein AMATHDRAFT_41278 [Amanita thiersii Skay4041]|uniref:Uncharacterized protein n=1 Tax=Amanita thiersii Skay4041 TaxID=703135 RepID=A0A2A9NQ57_9AGAR|nr:hypothetical protein AMATHDRAFT_41278 [Amanita thiersii Skay4041]